MKRISIVLYIVIGIFVIAAGALAQNQLKLGVVDTQKVVEEYERAKEAQKKLKGATDKLRAQLEKIREEIGSLEERLTKQKLFLEKPETESLQNDINLKQQEYQRELGIGQESIVAKEKELFEPILKDIEILIKEIGKNDGYNLILEKRLVTLYVDPSYDLTETVVQTLNKRYEESNPPEAGAAEKAQSPK